MSVKVLPLIFGPGAEGIFLTSEMGFGLSKKKIKHLFSEP